MIQCLSFFLMSDSLVSETLGPQGNARVLAIGFRKAPASAEVLHVLHTQPLLGVLLKFEFRDCHEYTKYVSLSTIGTSTGHHDADQTVRLWDPQGSRIRTKSNRYYNRSS
jgi:hypothetical protein